MLASKFTLKYLMLARTAAAGFALALSLVGAARPAQAQPANDLFARAVPVSGLEGRVSGTTVGATLESGEDLSSPISTLIERVGTVWYRWVAPSDGLTRFGADGSARGLAIDAFTGTNVSALDEQRDSDDRFAATVFRAEAGQAYYIQVSSANNGAAPFTLTYAHTPAPPNDDFARAITLRGANGVYQGATSGATNESGEDTGFFTGSVWFRYVAPANGRLTAGVFGFSPTLRLYTGSAISNLDQLSVGREGAEVQAGQTYYIQVSGRNADEGRFFRLTFSGPGAPSFSLSGRVTRPTFGGSLVGAAGVRVSAAGQAVTTDGLGYYNFLNLRPGSYTVAASLPGFTLSPPSQNVQLTTNLTTVDFRATPGTAAGAFSITGRVTDAAGRGLAGVTIARTGGAAVVTNSAGVYTIAGLSSGTFTLTPARAGFVFNPIASTVAVRGAGVSSIDFQGEPAAGGAASRFSISGRLVNTPTNLPLAGVTVTAAGGASAQSDANGFYRLADLAPGSHTLTLSRPGTSFSPSTFTVAVQSADADNVDLRTGASEAPRVAFGPSKYLVR